MAITMPKLPGLNRCLSFTLNKNLLEIAAAPASIMVGQWSARSNKLSPSAVISALGKLDKRTELIGESVGEWE